MADAPSLAAGAGTNGARRVSYSPSARVNGESVASVPLDMRSWLAADDRIGALRVIEGVDAEKNIGRVSEMLAHTDESPAMLFDRIPGYQPGWRVLVNSMSSRKRLAMSLGLDPSIGAFELMDERERLPSEAKPLPLEIRRGCPDPPERPAR